jgi:hypothetical protein
MHQHRCQMNKIQKSTGNLIPGNDQEIESFILQKCSGDRNGPRVLG